MNSFFLELASGKCEAVFIKEIICTAVYRKCPAGKHVPIFCECACRQKIIGCRNYTVYDIINHRLHSIGAAVCVKRDLDRLFPQRIKIYRAVILLALIRFEDILCYLRAVGKIHLFSGTRLAPANKKLIFSISIKRGYAFCSCFFLNSRDSIEFCTRKVCYLLLINIINRHSVFFIVCMENHAPCFSAPDAVDIVDNIASVCGRSFGVRVVCIMQLGGGDGDLLQENFRPITSALRVLICRGLRAGVTLLVIDTGAVAGADVRTAGGGVDAADGGQRTVDVHLHIDKVCFCAVIMLSGGI